MTTVGQLIELLQKFDPNLPVAVADWSEAYMSPSCIEASKVQEKTGDFWAESEDRKKLHGRFVQIGS